MESIQLCLQVFIVGFGVSLVMATMIKGLLSAIHFATARTTKA